MIGVLLRPPWLWLRLRRAIFSCVVWEHTVLYFLVWWPALCEWLHHSVWRQQPRIYEWADSPPEAERWQWSHGDVTLELERGEGSGMRPPIHSSLTFSHSLYCAHRTYPVMGSCYRRVTYTPGSQPLSFPAQPCPALARHAWSSTIDSGPSQRNPNFMLMLQHTKSHANLLNVYFYVRVL